MSNPAGIPLIKELIKYVILIRWTMWVDNEAEEMSYLGENFFLNIDNTSILREAGIWIKYRSNVDDITTISYFNPSTAMAAVGIS